MALRAYEPDSENSPAERGAVDGEGSKAVLTFAAASIGRRMFEQGAEP
jgi:hypothetical protein